MSVAFVLNGLDGTGGKGGMGNKVAGQKVKSGSNQLYLEKGMYKS